MFENVLFYKAKWRHRPTYAAWNWYCRFICTLCIKVIFTFVWFYFLCLVSFYLSSNPVIPCSCEAAFPDLFFRLFMFRVDIGLTIEQERGVPDFHPSTYRLQFTTSKHSIILNIMSHKVVAYCMCGLKTENNQILHYE